MRKLAIFLVIFIIPLLILFGGEILFLLFLVISSFDDPWDFPEIENHTNLVASCESLLKTYPTHTTPINFLVNEEPKKQKFQRQFFHTSTSGDHCSYFHRGGAIGTPSGYTVYPNGFPITIVECLETRVCDTMIKYTKYHNVYKFRQFKYGKNLTEKEKEQQCALKYKNFRGNTNFLSSKIVRTSNAINDGQYNDYVKMVRQYLKYPLKCKYDQYNIYRKKYNLSTLSAEVSIGINSNGSVRELVISRSSGVDELDSFLLDTIVSKKLFLPFNENYADAIYLELNYEFAEFMK